MAADIQKYRKHVDRFDLSDAKKLELIHTVFTAMEDLADCAFGLHTAQQTRRTLPGISTKCTADHVELKEELLSNQFKHAAGKSSGGKT